MTIKKSIKELRSRGYRVTYRQRKDGGVLIKSINGHKYKGAKGNKVARGLLGQKLSTARAYQLHRLNPRKGDDWTRPAAKVRTKLPEALTKELRSVQRLWRKGTGLVKAHTTIQGTISKGNLRYVYETYGEQVAWEKLLKAKRYTQGYAYEENIKWFQETLSSLADQLELYGLDISALTDFIEKLDDPALIERFQEEWLAPLHDEYYDLTRKGGAVSQEDVDNMVYKMNQMIK